MNRATASGAAAGAAEDGERVKILPSGVRRLNTSGRQRKEEVDVGIGFYGTEDAVEFFLRNGMLSAKQLKRLEGDGRSRRRGGRRQ